MKINKNIAPNTTKDEARRYAIDWQNWVSEQNLSLDELTEWQDYFKMVGEKFDLTDELKENGII